MNQLIIKTDKVDFQALVNKDTTLSINFQSKFIEQLQETFTKEEEQWYIANLYVYLNYHPTNEFPINLENVFKMIGFAHKKNAKRTLENNFTENEDYKVLLLPTEKQVKTNGGAGLNKEEIFMNVDTFKNLCMMAKTDKGKEIRKYYVKLENILHKIANDERLEYEHKVKELTETINTFELNPETEGFSSRQSGDVYCIKDTTKPGHFKIGIANRSITRVDQLNVGSSTHSLELYTRYGTFDRVLAEDLIHRSLQPFRIKNRKEWFYFKNDLELAFAIKTIKKSLEYIQAFDIKDYQQFKELTAELDIKKELLEPQVSKELQVTQALEAKRLKNKIKETNKNNIQQSGPQTGNYKGVCYVTEKQQWKAELQFNHKHCFLGYYQDEVDAAKVYNNYALYLNENENTNYFLNQIPGYINVSTNVMDDIATQIQSKKASKYNGVSYDAKRKLYTSSIKMSRKTYNLGSSQNELDCAKLYNQQALFFNTNLSTNYLLNDIDDYITIPKNIHQELLDLKTEQKTSTYQGVSLTKANKWVCSYVLNRKKIHIGTFQTEIEACQAYNETVIELNKNGANYKVNVVD